VTAHAGRVTSPDPAVDAAGLLARIALRDERALKQFYDAYHTRIYAFANRRLNNSADAADALNETMLEVWRSAGRYEGRSQALTWVLGIAHHKTLDVLRRRGRHDTVEIDETLPDDDCPTAPELLNAAQHASFIRRCLEQLTDIYKLVLHLAFFEDLPYAEIARIADCPLGTVKTRVFHGKRLLKECLQAQLAAGLDDDEPLRT
jgi:RNA polymerase sigma-70 factor (ECF subfamily)